MTGTGTALKISPIFSRIVSSDEIDYLTFDVFPGGVSLITSFMEVLEPTEVCFPHDKQGLYISAQYFLSGEASIVMGNGGQADWTRDGTSVVRSDTPGFRLIVQPGQVLRHVCVGMYHHALNTNLTETPCSRFDNLMATGTAVNLAVPVPTDSQVRATAERLYHLRSAKGLDRIKAEGLAIGFLSEVLDRYGQQALDSAGQNEILPWQDCAAREIRAAIDAQPGRTFSGSEMLDRFRMGEHMARRVFQSMFGTTIAAYTRTARLTQAREAFLGGSASVKQVGFDCGYAHIGNFTRAYKQQFGETPSDTKARAVMQRRNSPSI